ncbi:PREDICTED: KRAB domain-containing protein 1 [Chinchilla lanigera]|uniref:KRAB domain-containing protein 1 n=1 Tax=Chinchilla lanigera TaxID=34839 RepID=UPI00038F126A|nr:PREDICTED: KRAB domain-containing protein 1 [Chinchilla lanigera]XP_013368989.1 PREDICTED: KRAB domain-containing protein 1 [Chinchilla lanigera]XP_013368990.1 PREDICTED: KRAB domain-containing protein 1 [Chinchilla lanigera]
MMTTVSKPEDSQVFDDVEVPFSEKEWTGLKPTKKALYAEVIADNYRTVASLAAASMNRQDPNFELEQEREALIRRGWEAGLADYILKLRRYTRLVYRYFVR